MTIIVFFIILSVLILIHELGHFIAAKKNGVEVEEFGFGLPPRIFGKKIGKTFYSINLLPIGGFVKLFGEEVHEIDNQTKSLKKQKLIKEIKEKAFIYKKPWQKAMIVLGGVFMNLVLGVLIFYITLSLNQFKSTPIPIFLKDYQFKFGEESKKVIITRINKNSPAEKSGLKEEDIVLRYKTENTQWKNIRTSKDFINAIKDRKEEKVFLEVINNKNGRKKTAEVKPVYSSDLKRYIIGVSLADSIVIEYSKPLEKVFSGFIHSYNLIDYNFKIFGYLISSSIKEKNPSTITQSVTGPIGIFAVVDDTVRKSGEKLLINLLELSALISLSLAIMNILPLPALDGGRMIFVLYEWIFKKQPNKNIEKYVNLIGFLFLLLLALIVAINDIIRFF